MNKPVSMSVKEYIIKRMAISMVVPEKIIDQVINFQFDSANDALNTKNTIEISGFGKFSFNKKKAQTLYNKLLNIQQAYTNTLAEELTDKKRKTTEVRMESVLREIKILKPKIDAINANNRGVEESSTS